MSCISSRAADSNHAGSSWYLISGFYRLKANAYTLLVNIFLCRAFQVGQLTPIMREVVGTEFLAFTF